MGSVFATEEANVQEQFDIMLPLFELRWCTQGVLEGLTKHYNPRSLHVVCPGRAKRPLEEAAKKGNWNIAPLTVHAEENFFGDDLTKQKIFSGVEWGEGTLYQPGWLYQQVLKLGAAEAIPGLSDWFLVWDSDSLPIDAWPVAEYDTNGKITKRSSALVQDKTRQGWKIVKMWDQWTRAVVGHPLRDDEASTFVAHHMWFNRQQLQEFFKLINAERARVEGASYKKRHWTIDLFRSAADFGSFSEYWAYATWIEHNAIDSIYFYPYSKYGARAERFFDDGTDKALFSKTLRETLGMKASSAFSPSYEMIEKFTLQNYKASGESPPSVLSFEGNIRHLEKGEDRMHTEELRTRWNPAVKKI